MKSYTRANSRKTLKKARKLPLPDLKIIFEVISILEQEATLDAKYKDPKLIGNWYSFRECHIKPDLLLIYKRNSSELQLARIGTHSDLF